jgi:hypothetical protein
VDWRSCRVTRFKLRNPDLGLRKAAERKAESLLQPYRPDVLLPTNLDVLRRLTSPRLVVRAAFG